MSISCEISHSDQLEGTTERKVLRQASTTQCQNTKGITHSLTVHDTEKHLSYISFFILQASSLTACIRLAAFGTCTAMFW